MGSFGIDAINQSLVGCCLTATISASIAAESHPALPVQSNPKLLGSQKSSTTARRHSAHAYAAFEALGYLLLHRAVDSLRAIMDYSTSIHDADNPAGASPWGSSPVSSPQHARTSSFPTSGDVPPSPTPYSSHRSENPGYSTDDTISGNGYSRPESSAGTESVSESDGHSHRPDTAESMRSQPDGGFANQQQQQAAVQYQAQTQRQEPQRYSSVRPKQQQTPGPQYKLQAKITGLERTGRKDPILRFDIHVGF